jgi:hypothetical protein
MNYINVLIDGRRVSIPVSSLGVSGLPQEESTVSILPTFWNKRKSDNADIPYPLLFSMDKINPQKFYFLPKCTSKCYVFTVVDMITVPRSSVDYGKEKVRFPKNIAKTKLSFLGKTLPLDLDPVA